MIVKDLPQHTKVLKLTSMTQAMGEGRMGYCLKLSYISKRKKMVKKKNPGELLNSNKHPSHYCRLLLTYQPRCNFSSHLVQSSLCTVPLCTQFCFLHMSQLCKCTQELQVGCRSHIVVSRKLCFILKRFLCYRLVDYYTRINLKWRQERTRQS